MIEELNITGFKRFSNHNFSLAPLTVLAGMNGGGKTSVIHSLLLAYEASRKAVVELNGPFGLELGTLEDIQNWDAPELIEFILKDETGSYKWSLGGEQTALYAKVTSAPNSQIRIFDGSGRRFQYLSAERLGPRNTLGSAALPSELLQVGTQGEFSAQVLYTLGGEPVADALRCPNFLETDAPLLKFETERWLSLITRSVQIDTEPLPITSLNTLRFRTPVGEWVRPPNMGFGVTYALPVILAGLTAANEGLLIVENPEAHLHPAGQSHMGHFLAKVASAGVQVIVETHSDHILNGIRRAIGEKNVLPANQAIVHFFDGDTSTPTRLSFTEGGGISSWPKGFFDQYQTDIAAITKIRRAR